MYVPLHMYLTLTMTITLGPTNSSTRSRHLNHHRVCHGRANPRPILRDGLLLSSRCQFSAELLDSSADMIGQNQNSVRMREGERS